MKTNVLILMVEFAEDLDDPTAVVTELAQRVAAEEIAINLRTTKVKPVKVVGGLATETMREATRLAEAEEESSPGG